jgi:hypothetical protein
MALIYVSLLECNTVWSVTQASLAETKLSRTDDVDEWYDPNYLPLVILTLRILLRGIRRLGNAVHLVDFTSNGSILTK